MKKILLVTLMCVVTIGAMAQKETKTKEKAVVTFSVPMDGHCCVTEISEGLAFEKGVKNVKCSYENKTVKITYRTDKTNKENLKKAIENLGKKNVKEVVEDKASTKAIHHEGCNHSHK
jgi:copper chaperone CopZ